MKRTKLEKLSSIVELTIDSFLKYMKTDEERIYVYRYNYSIEEFHREIEKNINVDTSTLKVSKFMEQLISNHINKIQSIELVYSRFPGYRDENIRRRKKLLDNIYGI